MQTWRLLVIMVTVGRAAVSTVTAGAGSADPNAIIGAVVGVAALVLTAIDRLSICMVSAFRSVTGQGQGIFPWILLLPLLLLLRTSMRVSGKTGVGKSRRW
jgi:hypothetical protein